MLYGLSFPGTGGSGFILNDGKLVRFFSQSSSCSNTEFTIPSCLSIAVDVNGFKKPNTVGKDIFYIVVTDNSIKPVGAQGVKYPPSTSCIPGSTNSSNNGYGCSAKYLYE